VIGRLRRIIPVLMAGGLIAGGLAAGCTSAGSDGSAGGGLGPPDRAEPAAIPTDTATDTADPDSERTDNTTNTTGTADSARPVVPPVETIEEFGWFRRFVADPDHVRLVWRDDAGVPLAQFESARRHLDQAGESVRLLVNGGIYQPGLRPGGLHIESGQRLVDLNLNDGGGNFHLKPNGVFWIAEGTAAVTESGAYQAIDPEPTLAVQSGPMLTIDGGIHPAFRATSDSVNRRTGVGVRADGRVVFLASTRPVNLHTFAQAFLDSGVPNSLYLDGGRPARMVEIVDDERLTPHIPLAAMLAVVDPPP
jgi:uncharacterized protein YigE (DUF2233 family)